MIFYKISRNLKQALNQLPGNLGPDYLIPLLRLFLKLSHLEQLYHTRNKRRIAITEARRIESLVNSGVAKRAIVVHDLSCSPLTFGDFIDGQVMLARYFSAKNIKVDFFIVHSEFCDDYQGLCKKEEERFVLDLKDIAEKILDNKVRIRAIHWNDLLRILRRNNKKKTIIPFESRVLKRDPTYNSGLNLINHLVFSENEAFLQNFLLSFDELLQKQRAVRIPQAPYISWHCRYSLTSEPDRNIKENEFVAIYETLNKLFPENEIMIITDVIGTDYFHKLAKKYELNCLFSKDYSDTLMGDGALILGSDYYFQLRSGGMYVFPVFSVLPYEIILQTCNQIEWNRDKIVSWAHRQQRFTNAAAGFPCH